MTGNGNKDRLIGAKVIEVSGHTSKVIDWDAAAKVRAQLPEGEHMRHNQYPTKEVMHYFDITLELPDGSRVELGTNSYYDSYWMEARA